MSFDLRLLLLLLALAPAGVASVQAQAQRPEPAPPRTERPNPDSTPTEKDARPRPPPIAFFLARGEPDACGPGCSEWIAADGTITPDAGRRLNEFLRTLGNRKLPIYFHSPGGSVAGAVAI